MAIYRNRRLEIPGSETLLFKYMSYRNFQRMINGGLFFCKITDYPDPWDESYPPHYLEYFKELRRRTTKSKVEERYINNIRDNLRRRQDYAVLCLFSSVHESYGMWRPYASMGRGVYIKFKLNNLEIALRNFVPNIYIGRVQYYDYYNRFFYMKQSNVLFPIFSKRIEYQFEHEIRLCIARNQLIRHNDDFNRKKGYLLNIEDWSFIEEIVLSPKSSKKFLKDISSTLRRLRLEIPVRKSSLFDCYKINL